MGSDRRLVALFVVLVLIGLPAFALRILCVGHSCDGSLDAAAEVPFCSLPEEVRSLVTAGFREDRSADLLGVTSAGVTIAGGDAFSRRDLQPQWPSVAAIPRRVPLVFAGAGLVAGTLPDTVGLHDVAPTLASLMGIDRPHPEVRSGRAIPQVETAGAVPLVVQIVWRGVGSADLEDDPQAWQGLRAIADEGMSSLEAEVPSLPADPAAVLTTIGTGGLPSEHGITGTIVRNEAGEVVTAWGRKAPVSIIAALGDDLDEVTGQRARVGLIAADPADRGVVGKDWYVGTDRDDIAVAAATDRELRRLLDRGYGEDDIPDLLAITLSGSIGEMDRITANLVETIEDEVPDAVVAITSTGSPVTLADLRVEEVVAKVDGILGGRRSVVDAASPGGIFLNRRVVTSEAIDEDEIADAMARVTDSAGKRAFADVFPAIAVSLGRYC